MSIKNISILGSTGSIGNQTLDVIRKNPNLYRVEGLTVNKSIGKLLDQINEFKPKAVAIYDELAYENFMETVNKNRSTNSNLDKLQVYKGLEGLIRIAGSKTIDILVTAVVGMIGLLPTVEAIKNSTTIALANKETLVTAGQIVMDLARKHQAKILPVDSEHSAIFQCLNGEASNKI
ncbi:MAG: 1-deoxy-D-xylulose-5-phosphate reductoisomerase, partial [Peptostreptococcus stomatis]